MDEETDSPDTVATGGDAAGAGAPGHPVAGRILVVEDDQHSRALMQAILGGDGYQLSFAEDGGRAETLLGGAPFDLIVLDIQLPVANGFHLASRIRAGEIAGCRADVPILAVTAFAMRGDRERVLDAGIDGYLSKPIDIVEVRSEIRRLIGPRPVSG